jgi:hypothetical protein
MFSFRVEGLLVDPAAPAEVFVSIWLPEAYDAQSGWHKFDEATSKVSDYSNFATYNGNRVTLRLVDGGFGDQDGVVNGVIVDPSGPVVAAAAPPSPPPPPTGGGSGNSGDSGGDGGGGGSADLLALLALIPALRRRQQKVC